VESVVEGLFDSVGWRGRLVGGWNSRCGSYLKRGGEGRKMYFSTWPSRRRRVLIWERRSGSWVVGVYAVAAFGTRTGVTGCD
jgi:hypothetical protein